MTSRRLPIHLLGATVCLGAVLGSAVGLPGGATAAPVTSASVSTPATVTPATLARAASTGTPGKAWRTASYTPKRGHWRDYVLAPTRRNLHPTEVQSVLPRGGSVTGRAETLVRHDGKAVRITSTGDRTASPLVVLDFGKEVSGPVRVRVTGASETRPELHVCYSESLEYLARYAGQNDGETAHAPGCDTANIWNGFPGTSYTEDTDSHTLPLGGARLPAQLEDPELRGGFRYATLFLDGPGYVDVDDVSMRFTAASGQKDLTAYPGHFNSSDDQLNRIWYAGAYTVQINTDRSDTAKSWPYAAGESDHADNVVPGADPDTDVIYDGGKRDRIIWQGDLAVQGPVAYLSTHDVPAVENSLTSLAGQQLPDGYMPAESQVGPHNADELRTYGEYVTWFVSNMAEHYRYTADRGYLRHWWPALQKATAWLEQQRDDTGLISFKSAGSCGHYGYSDCGHETYVNSLYARNLDQMATLARAVDDAGLQREYAARADDVRGAVNAHLWDAEAGAYRLSTEIPGAYPQDGNAMAVLAGIASKNQARRAMTYLQRNSWGDIGALTVSPSTPNASLPSFYAPLPSSFEAEARLTAPGADPLEQQSSFTLMKRFWGWMLRQDPGSTFWEHVQPDQSPNLKQFSSLAHGWAAGPTITLTDDVLGVSPVAAGYSTFAVKPHPGSLRWAEGTVPTPHGRITTSWDHTAQGFALTLKAPSGTRPTVSLPATGKKARVTVDGRTRTLPVSAGYVTVRGLSSGRHVVRTTLTRRPATRASVSLSPASDVAEPGDLQAYDATVSGQAPGRLTGTLRVTTPHGWKVGTRTLSVRLASNGRPVTKTYRFFVRVPDDALSGTFRVGARLGYPTGSGPKVAKDVSSVRLSRTQKVSDFESGTDDWEAGANVESVAQVSGFANGPGRPYAGSGALEATGAGVPGQDERTVFLQPATAIDLSEATSFLVRLDSYGGAPGASGYQGTVRLTGDGGDVLEKSFAVNPDGWNTLELDVSSWAARGAVSRVEVSFSAPGGTTPWSSRFQVDGVEWVG
jgi:hypothetical protein